MTKTELVRLFKEVPGLASLSQAENACNAVFSLLGNLLKNGAGFGTFKTVKCPARKGRNPRTGAEIQIPASRDVKFTPARHSRKICSFSFVFASPYRKRFPNAFFL